MIAILGIPFLFVIGAIFPDIDLPKDNRITRLIYNWFIPLFVFFSFLYGITKVIDNTTIATSIAGLVTIFIYYLFWLINNRSAHWGKVHSIFAGILFSTGGFMLFAMWSGLGGLIWAFLSAFAFFLGYLNHLTCDEWHSFKKGTKWNRRALKLWKNDWKYDPIIRIIRMIRTVR